MKKLFALIVAPVMFCGLMLLSTGCNSTTKKAGTSTEVKTTTTTPDGKTATTTEKVSDEKKTTETK